MGDREGGGEMPRRGTAMARWRRGCLTIAMCVAAVPVGMSTAAAQPADTLTRTREPLFTTSDLATAGIFAVATIGAWPVDREFAEYAQGPVQERAFIRKSASIVEHIAQPGAIIIGGTLYLVGKLGDSPEAADLGLHGSEAILVGLALTGGIKVLAGRARPYVNIDDPHNFGLGRGLHEDKYRSFPSGHTLIGFAAAAAVTDETHRFWPRTTWIIAPVMYGGAAMVGLSRMYNNKHWASDVLVGAAIGVFSGRKVVRYNHTHPGNEVDNWLLGVSILSEGRTGWRWVPIITPAPSR